MSKSFGKLREYETLFVLNPDLIDDAVNTVVERAKEVLARLGAHCLRDDRWGKRKLSYEIAKHGRGSYVLLHYVGNVGVAEEIARTLRNAEEVIRFLTTAHGEVNDVEARRAEVDKTERERAANRARIEAERQERETRIAAESSGQRDRDSSDNQWSEES